jgi:hypothetical protein
MPSIYKTARGAMIDIDSLRLANETVVAVGNARVNARGDQIDEYGNIIATRNQVMDRHYNTGQTGTKVNIPRNDTVLSGTQEVNRLAQENANTVDNQKLQDTISKLTQQLAEKEALLSKVITPDVLPIPEPTVELKDEIDSMFEPPAAEPVAPTAKPLRGGLAKAIAKQKESEEERAKNKRI